MKLKRIKTSENELGDIDYIYKFAILPIETKNYKIWMEKYVEVWSYREFWHDYSNGGRSFKPGWYHEYNLSLSEFEDYKNDNKERELIEDILIKKSRPLPPPRIMKIN